MEEIKEIEKSTKVVDLNKPNEAGDRQPIVYKFSQEASISLEIFLNNRPLMETDAMCRSFFEHGKTDPVFTEESIGKLIDYLGTCPRGQVRPLFNLLMKGGGLIPFTPTKDESGKIVLLPIKVQTGTDTNKPPDLPAKA